MNTASPTPARAAQAAAGQSSQFTPDRSAFAERIQTQRQKERENLGVAKAHLIVFASRMASAMKAIEEGNVGTARSFLEIGQHDYEAAINALPQ